MNGGTMIGSPVYLVTLYDEMLRSLNGISQLFSFIPQWL